MRNPLKRQPTAEPKPTLRERAAALRASAGQIMRPAASSPTLEAAALPAPGSDEARAAFAEACREHSRLTLFANDYPELKRTPLEWWTRETLGRARELGEISPEECARLHPIASDRELRIDAISHRLKLGALHALAFANDPPMPAEAEHVDWHNPPDGFMAHPAIEPGGFLKITAALPLEAERLHGIAEAEFERRSKALQDHGHGSENAERIADLRRALRLDAWAVVASSDRSEPAGNDATLTLLGREFDAAHMAWREAVEANREPHSRYAAYLVAAKAQGGPSRADCHAAASLPGVSEAGDAEEKAFETAGELALTALRLPARTLADLAVQARAVIPHVWAAGSYEAGGAPDADEAIDKEVVRSLIESCCAAAGVDWRGAPVGEAPAVEPVDTEAAQQQNPLGDLLTGLDLSAMSMRTLSALHDHVETLNSICYGLAAQPCSLKERHTPNEAGIVLYRLAEDLLQRISNACANEAKRRDAAGDEFHIRIAMLARQIIENDDRDETRALARDLLVMTEA